jgi:outer membrane protein
MYIYACAARRRFLMVGLLSLTIFLSDPITVTAQGKGGSSYRLSLAEVIGFAKSQNKLVLAANIGEEAVAEDRKDAYHNALPTVNASGSYQRFSGLTLFTDGLTHSTTGPRKPGSNSAALGVDALLNVYGGGKQGALEREQDSRLNLARLNTREQSGNTALQTASQYLDLIRLNELKEFILDQLKRAQTRLSNINSFYKNQKVTRSDVLRAEVVFSNVELALEQNENDMTIANQKLNILINVPDSVVISPADSAGMRKPEIASLLHLVETGTQSSYAVQKAAESVEQQKAKLRGVQSNNLPGLGLFAAYGLNYPNYLFFLR